LYYSYFDFDITVGGVRETVDAGPEGLRFAYNAPLPDAAVPEFPAWAMLLLGFAGLGYAGRLSRTKSRSPIAAA
jgi:hypothetical protein